MSAQIDAYSGRGPKIIHPSLGKCRTHRPIWEQITPEHIPTENEAYNGAEFLTAYMVDEESSPNPPRSLGLEVRRRGRRGYLVIGQCSTGIPFGCHVCSFDVRDFDALRYLLRRVEESSSPGHLFLREQVSA